MDSNFDTNHKIEDIPSTYICGMCNKIFKERTDFEDHIVSHGTANSAGNNAHECSQTHAVRSSHKRTAEKGEKVFNKQNLDETTFLEQQELLQCQNSETINCIPQLRKERFKFTCDICNKFCTSNTSLKEHKLIHSGERPHKCEKCLRTFRFYHNFLRHQLTHEEPTFECKICPKVYASKDSLKKHFFARHADETPDGFNCSLCEKQFLRIDSLWHHYLKHVYRYSFECKVCNKTFETRLALKSHARIHKDSLSETAASSPNEVKCNSISKCVATENPGSSELLHHFKCNTCGRNFQTVTLLQKHLLSHSEIIKNNPQSGENIKICQVVTGESLSQSSEDKQASLMKEISVNGQNEKYAHDSDVVSEQNRKKKGKYVCRTCNKHFKAQICLAEHESIHSGEKAYKCEKCSKRFGFYNNLVRHTLIHGKPTYECEACGDFFFTKDTLKRHSVSHLNSGIQSVSASTEEDRATSKSVLNNAYNNTNELVAIDNSAGSNQILIGLQTQEHAEGIPQKISFQGKFNCEKNITLETAVKIEGTDSAHQSKSIQKFSRSSDKEFKAKKLQIISGSSDVVFSLKRCKGKGKYFCTICNKRFRGKKHLEKHKTTPSGKKIYKCDKCPKSFEFYRNFFKHARTHGKPSFKCEVCQKMFVTKGILKEHFNRKHSYKPKNRFKCTLCGKVLFTKQSLQRHNLIHTGEKPLTCEICNKGFTKKYYLLIHQHTHVSEKYFSQYLLKTHCENELHCKKVKLSMNSCNKNLSKVHAIDHVKNTDVSILCSERNSSVNDQPITIEDIQSFEKIETSKSELVKESISSSDDQSIRDKSQSNNDSCPVNELLGKISEQKRTPETTIKIVETYSSYQSKSILESLLQDQLSTMKPDLAFAESNQAQEEISQFSDNLVCKENLSVPDSSHAMLSKQNCKDKSKYTCVTCEKQFGYRRALEEHDYIHSGVKPYKCDKCSRCFRFHGNFVRHAFTHEKPSFECEICKIKVRTKENLKRHKLSNHSDSFKCEICEKNLSTKRTLEHHYLTHTGENDFTCNICNERFAQKSLLMEHEQNKCKGKGKHTCAICKKLFRCKKALEEHQSVHTGVKPYKCHKCFKSFGYYGNYVVHSLTHEKPSFKCEICNKKLHTKESLKKHKLSNHSHGFKCEICNIKLHTKESLKKHKLSNHSNGFKCEICEKNLATKQTLQYHYFTHTGEKPFTCYICNKRYGQKKLLMRHERKHTDLQNVLQNPLSTDRPVLTFAESNREQDKISQCSDNLICKEKVANSSCVMFLKQNHRGKDTYSCSTCKRQFKCRRALEEHENVHTGAKPYKCDKCFRSFGYQSSFVRHALTHEKPSFECEICNKKLLTKEYLKRHKLSRHSNNFKCEISKKNLATKVTLQNHYLTHTGEKPFTCDICNKGFAHKSNLKQHEQIHNDAQNVLHDPLSTMKSLFTSAESNHEQEKILNSTDNLVCKENDPNDSHIMFSKQNYKGKGRYACSTCKKQFQCRKTLEEHENVHTGEKPYKCDKCSRCFSFHSNFVRHAFTHKEPSFECKICNKKLRTKENLKKHKLASHSNSFKCKICEKNLSTQHSLEDHYLTHTGENQFTCNICNERFAQKSLLMEHEQNNCKEKGRYACSTCKRQFKSRRALEEHENVHTGEKPYKCDECSRCFRFHSNFVRHAFTHGKPSFECEICNIKLRTKENLKKHKLSNHSNSFKCEICKKNLATKVTLQKHYLTHTGEKPFTCDICNKGFAHKSYLKQHEKIHNDAQNVLHNPLSTIKSVLTSAESNHEQEKIHNSTNNLVCKENDPNHSHIMFFKQNGKGKIRYVCSTCKKEFRNRKAFEEHKKSTHTGEKPYKCDKCFRSFGVYFNFIRHSLTHKEPSFECEICNKKLRTKDHLKKHKLATHSNSFKCEICEKKLSSKLSLQNHYFTHTGEKPFSCDICNKGFAQKSFLIKHEQEHRDKKHAEDVASQ